MSQRHKSDRAVVMHACCSAHGTRSSHCATTSQPCGHDLKPKCCTNPAARRGCSPVLCCLRGSALGPTIRQRCFSQRVVLLSYSKDTGRISFRHFSIRVAPSGVTKSLKGLLAGDRLPDMHDFADVSEFLTRSGYGSVRPLLRALPPSSISPHRIPSSPCAASVVPVQEVQQSATRWLGHTGISLPTVSSAS